MAAVAAAVGAVTVPTNLFTIWSSATYVTGYRLEARTKAGALEGQSEFVLGIPLNGSSSTPHPYQTSFVTSLRSGVAGASGRGRLYWPATGIPLGSADLRITSAAVTTTSAAIKTYLSGIQTAIDATFDGVGLVVWSRLQSAIHGVTSLQHGNVADVQRRRRDALVENYTTTTYP
jgi:hypothetical protein